MTIIQTLIGSYRIIEISSISFVSSDENSATSGTTASATIPATAAEGDIAIFSFAYDSGNTVISSGPSDWTFVGDNTSGSEYPEGGSYVKVLASGDAGSTVSATVNVNVDWTAFVSVYRPNVKAVSASGKSFVSSDGPSALGPLTITSSNDNGKAMIVYGWAAGRPVNQNPTETMSPAPDAYITGGSSNGDIAYKLYSKSDTAVNHTWSTTDTGRQVAHAFYVVPTSIPTFFSEYDTFELRLTNNNWVGITNLRFYDGDNIDIISSPVTWVNGSPSNDLSSISSGQFTTDSDYNTNDPRSGLHWSDSSSSGGLIIYFKPSTSSSITKITYDLNNRNIYGTPTPELYLDGNLVSTTTTITETGTYDLTEIVVD